MFLKSCADITYDDIISIENLLAAWREFRKGKRLRKDVQIFELQLMDNILDLHRALATHAYQHGPYEAFNISDPKPRNIHKASVRDRLVHHALYRQLYPAFDRTFIAHSYSCRKNKGTHKALDTFTTFARKVSKNHTKTAWVLKCDIKKFFASIDHVILLSVLQKKISDKNIFNLLAKVVGSFETLPGKGLPLGNLTSQLLVNIHMNEFDQFAKHTLKARYYIRYADDFVILDHRREALVKNLPLVADFLRAKLALTLHPDKVSISTFAAGVDFLGWVHFPQHRVLRTVTKRRVRRGVQGKTNDSPTVQSYLGLLQHGNTHKIQAEVRDLTDIAKSSPLC